MIIVIIVIIVIMKQRDLVQDAEHPLDRCLATTEDQAFGRYVLRHALELVL